MSAKTHGGRSEIAATSDTAAKLAAAILRYLDWRQRQRAMRDERAQQRRRRSLSASTVSPTGMR
jgi:hypothetical protein